LIFNLLFINKLKKFKLKPQIQLKSMHTENKTIIKLSLCGKKYEVEKYILERSLYFKDLFDEFFSDVKRTNLEIHTEEFYIPRAPIAFDHILNYLIYDGKYEVPKQFDQDMRYFLLEKEVEKEVEKEIEYRTESDEMFTFDIRRETCSKYGFLHGDEIIFTKINKYNGKKAKVIGVNDSYLWIHMEGDKGCSYFEGKKLSDIAVLVPKK
jgi:hypothetical protein